MLSSSALGESPVLILHYTFLGFYLERIIVVIGKPLNFIHNYDLVDISS